MVLINTRLRHVLHKPGISGRTLKSALELGEYQIYFSPRKMIQGQALADFLVECSFPDNSQVTPLSGSVKTPDTWILNTDGSTREQNKGAGFILEDPDEHQYAYAIMFWFLVSNNEAEYEALLAGLHGAKYLNLTNILVRIDSEVVIGQVTGVFEAKEENIKQYLACVQQLVSEFTSVNFEKVPR